jgi:hypothetical protein
MPLIVIMISVASQAIATMPNSICAVPPSANELASGKTFYVDPVRGSLSGDGSLAKPFKSLQFVLDPKNKILQTRQMSGVSSGLVLVNSGSLVKGGDTILLKSGNYGALSIANVFNDKYLVIKADVGAMPEFTRISVSTGSKFIFDGLRVRSGSVDSTGNLVTIGNDVRQQTTRDFQLRNMNIANVDAVSNFSPTDWFKLKTVGVRVAATCTRMEASTISNVRTAVDLGGQYITVYNNRIFNFSDDGIRFQNSNQTISKNLIYSGRNALADNGLHDAIQGFTPIVEPGAKEGILRNITVQRNKVFNFPRNGYRPLRGIGYYQGFVMNSSFTNNLVVTDSPFGMNLAGASNVVVAHNTVLGNVPSANTAIILAEASPQNTLKTDKSFLYNNIADTFRALPSRMENNIAVRSMTARVSGSTTPVVLKQNGDVVTEGNTRIFTADRLFVDPTPLFSATDPARGNYKLKSTSPAIDKGTNKIALRDDIDFTRRTQLPDIGAYAFTGVTVVSLISNSTPSTTLTGTKSPTTVPSTTTGLPVSGSTVVPSATTNVSVTIGGGTGVTPSTNTGGATGVSSGETNSGTENLADAPKPSTITCPTADGFDDFVARAKALPEAHFHDGDARMAADHNFMLGLVPRTKATHVAVKSGLWSDPKTWSRGCLPTAGAQVLIPSNITVKYNLNSNTKLKTVRVDGELVFTPNLNTKLIVDTMVVDTTGLLQIGTAASPVLPNVSAKILFPNNGDISVAEDPVLMSRGLVSHGKTVIHGARKTSFLKVAQAPLKGQTTLTLAKAPVGWRVGDVLVVTGTRLKGFAWNGTLRKVTHVPSEDEVVKIVAINGTQVTVDKPFVYDHTTPRSDLFAYVANMTRNVLFASEDGASTPLHQRGHVMLMNEKVDVRYAQFDDLGRTSKAIPAFDLAKLPQPITSLSNIKGRYPLHLHRSGMENQAQPAMVVGNAISRSQGWGYVQHSSHAHFIDNASFDIFGAGYAAEDGNETGIWLRNIAINSQGLSYGDWAEKNGEDVYRHDNGRRGAGFFFAGRLVRAAENVAANTTHGYVWMSRSAPFGPVAVNLEHPEIAYGADTVSVNTPPIRGFRDNEAFANMYGLIVIKSGPGQGHDTRTVLDGFLNWETKFGADVTYTAHYTLKNFDIVATNNRDSISNASIGVQFGQNSFDIVLNKAKISGFPKAVNLTGGSNFEIPDAKKGWVFIDLNLISNTVNYNGYNPAKHLLISSTQLVPNRISYQMTASRTFTTLTNLWPTIATEGVKVDSIGTYARGFGTGRYGQGRQIMDSLRNVAPYVRKNGYYKTPDGKAIVLLNEFISDRATGSLTKMSTQLEFPETLLVKAKIPYNGILNVNSAAPIATPDSVATVMNRDIVINPIANDRDPDGSVVRLDGFTDAIHGDLILQPDGKILYRPYLDYVGMDKFSYWAADNNGKFTKADVTIQVRGQ